MTTLQTQHGILKISPEQQSWLAPSDLEGSFQSSRNLPNLAALLDLERKTSTFLVEKVTASRQDGAEIKVKWVGYRTTTWEPAAKLMQISVVQAHLKARQ